jgi:hypothetical protein
MATDVLCVVCVWQEAYENTMELNILLGRSLVVCHDHDPKKYPYVQLLAPTTTSSLRKNDHLLRDHEQTSFATRRSKKRIE